LVNLWQQVRQPSAISSPTYARKFPNNLDFEEKFCIFALTRGSSSSMFRLLRSSGYIEPQKSGGRRRATAT
jgi:hypothetical protein